MRHTKSAGRRSLHASTHHRHLRGAAARRALFVAVVVAAGIAMNAPPAAALRVNSALVQFHSNGRHDRAKINGYLDNHPQSIEQFASVKIDIGPFSETIETHRFKRSYDSEGNPRRFYTYRIDRERVKSKDAAIQKIILDLSRGRFIIDARNIALTEATNPMPFRFAVGTSDECNMLRFSERPAYTNVYDYDDQGYPIPSTRRIAIDGSKRPRWRFLRREDHSTCEIAALEARPRGFTVNQPQRVRVEARLHTPGVSNMRVFQVDAKFDIVSGPLCTLRDDGTNGDNVAGDRIHSCRIDFFEHDPRIIRLVALGTYQGREITSPKFELDVVPQVIASDAAVFIENMYHARDIWGARLNDLGNTKAARKAAAQAIRALPFVRDATFNDDAFLLEFAVADHAGILGLLPAPANASRNGPLPPGGMSPAPPEPYVMTPMAFSVQSNVNAFLGQQAVHRPEDHRIKNTNVLFWAPFHDRHFPNNELNGLRNRYTSHHCPSFDVRVMRNEECTLASVRRFADYGTVVLATEGFYSVQGWELVRDLFFQRDPVFATGEPATAVGVVTQVADMVIRHEASGLGIPGFPERRSPRLLLYYTEDRGVVWALKPEFITETVGKMPNSVVFGGFRNSARSQAMAQAFLSRGASAYLGFTEHVTRKFIRDSIDRVFNQMLDGDDISKVYASVPKADPDSSAVMYFAGDGRGNYNGLVGVLNGDFEQSTLASWKVEADARVITRLGPYLPRDGIYMAILGTGIGDETRDGSIRQRSCVPAGQRWLRFDWNFLSAEFMQWCNQGFDDTFVVRVNGTPVFQRSVDQLCDTNLVQVPGVKFDGENVYATGWHSQTIDLAGFIGSGPATVDLEFAMIDDGGSVVDSAVLLDRIRFE